MLCNTVFGLIDYLELFSFLRNASFNLIIGQVQDMKQTTVSRFTNEI